MLRHRSVPPQVEMEIAVPLFEHGSMGSGEPFNQGWLRRRLRGN